MNFMKRKSNIPGVGSKTNINDVKTMNPTTEGSRHDRN